MFNRSGAATSHAGVVLAAVLGVASFMLPALVTFWSMHRLGQVGLGRTWADWAVLWAWPVALVLALGLEALGVGSVNFTSLDDEAGHLLGGAVGHFSVAWVAAS